jgi:hypothetical protein
MKIGDLVKPKSYCTNSERLAIIIEVPEYLSCVKILYTDKNQVSSALISNLEIISKANNIQND